MNTEGGVPLHCGRAKARASARAYHPHGQCGARLSAVNTSVLVLTATLHFALQKEEIIGGR